MEVAQPQLLHNNRHYNHHSQQQHQQPKTAASSSTPSSSRPFMAPPPHNSDSSYSNYSHTTPRSSDSTQNTAHSTLFPTPPAAPAPPANNAASSAPVAGASNVGPVTATSNAINRVAGLETSLFQICLSLIMKLRAIPDIDDQLLEVEEGQVQQDDDALATDPVNLLWTLFRRGTPLVILFNTVRPGTISIDETKISGARKEKAAVFQFLKACIDKLGFEAASCFILSDLYGEDTGGFVKVARVVSAVVDIAVEEGLISLDQADGQGSDLAPGAKRTHRQHIVDELVRTERTYVHHLEILQAFKRQVEQKGLVPGDVIHDIFLNLNALLDFQRRFLIRVEQVNAQPEVEQNWGHLFKSMGPAFLVYAPYIENQKHCEAVAMREFPRLKEVEGSSEITSVVESPTLLAAFLLKPFQRLAKYPLLLRELERKGDFDDSRKADLEEGRKQVEGVLNQANATLAREEKAAVVEQLKVQVDDWKGHRVEAFGALLLHGTFSVTKGDLRTDKAREYQMFLFEKILLCCKDQDANKQKTKIRPSQSFNQRSKPKLQLKGRIFMQNVTETLSMSSPGDYTCQIFWKGDDSIEYFIIRFQTEELLVEWRDIIEQQRRFSQEQQARQHQIGIADGENMFANQQQSQLEHVNTHDDELDDDATSSVMSSQSDLASLARNASNQSLRSRSTTGESGPPPNGAIPNGLSRFPGRLPGGLPNPALTLRTHDVMPSPGDRGGNSYFSPGVESPISTRTSSSSTYNTFPFPRQGSAVGGNNGWSDDQNRFTAPAGRTLVRDPVTGIYSVQPAGGPAGVAGGRAGGIAAHPAALTQNRSRSASSPDIHNLISQSRRTPVNAPPVPSIPSQLAAANPSLATNRSQSNSPIYTIPVRPTGTSPNGKRPSQSSGYPGYGGPASNMAPPPPRTASISNQGGMGLTSGTEMSQPSQIRVKVLVPSEGSTMTLVVGFNISYVSLRDRIDAKLQRVTNLSLQSGGVKLKYHSDGDLVSIQTDEDVQTAFETWREMNPEPAGQMGEIELYCQR